MSDNKYKTTPQGSLGLLALGHVGVIAMRKARNNNTNSEKKGTESNKEMIQNTITIVSGLPRSGTSMMMKMLDVSGLSILKDDKRAADINNQDGYFEFEPVKKLMNDNSWMGKAGGKAVKIIAQLLPFIDLKYKYNIIFMNRNLDEILMSQQKMIGKNQIENYSNLKKTYENQLIEIQNFINNNPGINCLHISYKETIEEPYKTAQKVAEFIQLPESVSAMESVVKSEYYRNRK